MATMRPPTGTPINRSDPLARGIGGAWVFDGRPICLDSSGNGFHGTAVAYGSPTAGGFTGGMSPYGPCTTFAGTKNYTINNGQYGLINRTTDGITIAAYFRASSAPLRSMLYGGYYLGGSYPGFALGVGINYATRLELWNASSWYVANTEFTDGKWHLWHATTGPSITGSYYRDGVADGSIPVSGTLVNTSSTKVLLAETPNGPPWTGDVGFIAVWGRVLTAGEIKAHAADPYRLWSPVLTARRVFVPAVPASGGGGVTGQPAAALLSL